MRTSLTQLLADMMTQKVIIENDMEAKIVDTPEAYSGKSYRGASSRWIRSVIGDKPVLIEVKVSLFDLPEGV